MSVTKKLNFISIIISTDLVKSKLLQRIVQAVFGKTKQMLMFQQKCLSHSLTHLKRDHLSQK